MTDERAQMLKNLEASLVQLDYVAADLAQDWSTEGETAAHELQASLQKMRAARCALEIALEIFSDFERTQEAQGATGRVRRGRRA